MEEIWKIILRIFWGSVSLICISTGEADKAIKILLFTMIIDYISGIIKAIYTRSLNSRTGAKGFLKKIMILCIIILAHHIDIMLDIQSYRYNCRFLTIAFYFANEGLSILENSVTCGVPVPNKIREVLEQCKNKDIRK
ncbi:phage holin family protein [Fusobacterium hominis]|uniref:Phage holin family protein n=1 Tax=Fusobacterium hominis TaxID=2764326 RepID=A0A7G9GXK2_9FUSO|nr:phage holin family protein [Fusobacterium hominis]QNM15534.1 phage holin family protein [Fusobacterium hominis]